MVQRLNELRGDLCQISSFEIEQVIFSSSRKEGSSEVDLLKRFIDIKNNQAVSDCFTNNTGVINKLSCIRKAQTAIPKNEAIEKIEKFAEYRDLELFDTTVNNLHSPLSVGDIFNFGTEAKPKYWILIGQECDLQIRDDYKSRKTSEVFLVPVSEKKPLTSEIVQTQAKSLTNPKKFADVLRDFTGHQYHYQIPILKSGANIDLSFRLNDAVAVNIEILDWCVYNDDGSLRISPELNTEYLMSLLHLPGWKKKLANDLSEITANEGIPAKYECFSFCNSSDFKVSKSEDSLMMKGKRVKRLRAPYKNELVQKFYAYKARNAFDHDFLK